jgi:predicted HTH transcriptional regulator
MLPIRFEDIGPDDILRLIEDSTSQRKVLEYKQTLNIGPDNERAEFLADVSSFANASRGEIILGVSDKRHEDGNPTGIPDAIFPFHIGNPATERARIEQIRRWSNP